MHSHIMIQKTKFKTNALRKPADTSSISLSPLNLCRDH